MEIRGKEERGFGTWVSQVRGWGCEEEGCEVRLAWGQWRQQGSDHELCVSTQHTEKGQADTLHHTDIHGVTQGKKHCHSITT